MPTNLTPATAARLEALADQLDAEALGRLPFGSGELAEALAQGNAVRALAGLAEGKAGVLSPSSPRTVGDLFSAALADLPPRQLYPGHPDWREHQRQVSERLNPLIGGIISAYLGEEV